MEKDTVIRAAHIRKGIRAARTGKFDKAAKIFQIVLDDDPLDADALHFLGVVQHRLGRPNRAISLITRSLAQDAENTSAHNNLGNIFKEEGRAREAEACYRDVLKRDPINAECLNNIAIVRRNEGDMDGAIALLQDALAIAPEMTEAHHNLATSLMHVGRYREALEAYELSFKHGGDWSDPVKPAKLLAIVGRTEAAEDLLVDYLDRHPRNESARFHLAAMRGERMERASDTYVSAHFDQFAASFDAILKKLDYRAPQLVADTVARRLGEPAADRDMLDLGCGTGLTGPLIAPYKARLVGVDLSKKMLVRSGKRGCYDDLTVADLEVFMGKQTPESFDVVTCVDTLVYLGALERTFAGVARVLRPGGFFVGTVEKLDDAEEEYRLGAVGRFMHARAYIETLAAASNLDTGTIEDVVLRMESGKPVGGYVFELLSRKRG